MKRAILFGLAGALALSTAASAQLMGNGHFWYSGDGSIPNFSEAIDGDLSNIKANGYHLSWAPSQVFQWGDTYGYSRDSDLESRRIRIYAIDLDNNLYLADGEDPAENGTDADLTTNYYFAWDADNLYIAGDNIDNHYDIIPAPDGTDLNFWQRDTFWITMDLSDGAGANNGANIVDFRASPVNLDEAGHSLMVTHYADGEATQILHGEDPSYFLGAELVGGPNATGYFFETNPSWDLLFLFQPELRSNVGAGFAFRGRFIIPDPDGDDSYGQTYFGGDQNDLGTNAKWPRFVLTDANTTNQTAVEATTWGAVKSLYR
jgi:hypothetical protein